MLSTSLLSLADIMFILCLQLSLSITSNTRNSSANSTTDSVRNARSVVAELSLCFLAFAFGVLLGTCAFEVLNRY